MGQNNVVLTLFGVSKQFGGATALSNVSVSFEKGKVHSLVGENGAGKSTLGKILLGVHQPTQGQIKLGNQPTIIKSPAQANSSGLVGIAQELSLLENRSVADNIALGREARRGPFVDNKATRQSVLDVMDYYDMHLAPDARAGALPVAEQQKVEILRALSRDAQLIGFDEPTARLASHEAEQLLKLVKRLAQSGKAIIYISHFLDEILEISDEITILRGGELVRTSPGAALQNQFPDLPTPDLAAPPVLKVDNLTQKGNFKNISFDIKPGEILGFAGLVGAGRSELAHCICGATQSDSGTIQLSGNQIDDKSIKQRINAGLAMIPESRRDQGLIMQRSILENTSLPHLEKFQNF